MQKERKETVYYYQYNGMDAEIIPVLWKITELSFLHPGRWTFHSNT